MFVYILQNGDTDVVKIGKALDVEQRRGQLRTGNPEALTVIDTIETDDAGLCEKFLHRSLQSKRLRGEFFGLTAAQAKEAGRRLRRFLAEDVPVEKEAKLLAKAECESPPRPATERERAVHRELLEKNEAKYLLEIECARLSNQLKVGIGTSEGLDGLASWRTHTVSKFDEAAFRQAHPDLHAAFSHPARQRTFRLLWA
jgi:hypothetical protein